MNIHKITNGNLQTNTYLLQEENEFLLIDPASDDKKTIEKMKAIIGKGRLHAILYTHNHFDHIGGGHRFKEIPQYMHPFDIKNMKAFNQKYYMATQGLRYPQRLQATEEEMRIGPFQLHIVHTPGHSKGSVCIGIGEELFTADSIFKNGYGRTDLLFGNEQEMRHSIEKLTKVPYKNIYPGHGKETSLESEKEWMLQQCKQP